MAEAAAIASCWGRMGRASGRCSCCRAAAAPRTDEQCDLRGIRVATECKMGDVTLARDDARGRATCVMLALRGKWDTVPSGMVGQMHV